MSLPRLDHSETPPSDPLDASQSPLSSSVTDNTSVEGEKHVSIILASLYSAAPPMRRPVQRPSAWNLCRTLKLDRGGPDGESFGTICSAGCRAWQLSRRRCDAFGRHSNRSAALVCCEQFVPGSRTQPARSSKSDEFRHCELHGLARSVANPQSLNGQTSRAFLNETLQRLSESVEYLRSHSPNFAFQSASSLSRLHAQPPRSEIVARAAVSRAQGRLRRMLHCHLQTNC